MNTPEMRERCASQLLAAQTRANRVTAFIGLDGFVDEILHVVDQRDSAEKYRRLANISQFSARLSAAAGRGTNLELVSQGTRLGGNGPIMANALSRFGARTACLGLLGHPKLHPVFDDFSRRADLYSIGEPARTDALEFEDGKIMLGKLEPLKQMNWDNLCARFGREKLAAKISSAQLVGLVNWTMLPHMNEIWEAILDGICPALRGARRKLFVDLADPEKRTAADIRRALELIVRFERYFDVTLGLNAKEAGEIGKVLGFDTTDHSPEGLAQLALKIQGRVPVNTLLIHPTACALAVEAGIVSLVEGPFTLKPRITTGAGDHFNAGYCLGKLLGFDNAMSLLTGVATSGHYVRTANSPALSDLPQLLRRWPGAAS